MHQTRLRLGVATTLLDLASIDGTSKSEVLSQHFSFSLFILSSKEWLICEPTTQLSERFIPGEYPNSKGELELLKESSCNISPILDNMLKAKLQRTLE